MAVPDDHLVDDPLHAVALRCELALLDGALDKNVVALVKGHGDAREVTVERQVVPVGVLLWLSVCVLVPVTFAKPDIGDGRSRGKVSDGGFGRNIANHFEAVSLHVHSSPFSK